MIPRAPLWYELLWRLALPFALLRLWWRGLKEPGYRRHVGERFGRYPVLPDARPAIWIHAVSVGETRAAEPLVAALRERYPDHRLVLTHMTAAGRATGQALLGNRVTQAYFPYDTSFGASRFLDWCRPCFGLLMETELWPNMILRTAARGIPVFLVNARMSEKSARGYGRFARMSKNMLQALAGVAAQTAADAERLTRLGANRVAVTGNVKFDIAVPDTTAERGRALRRLFGESRPVWVAGSTRDGEETLLLAALARAPLPADALLVIVPRHPQRFDAVAELLGQRGLQFVRRSAGQPVPARISIVLGDTMGEMLAYYTAADVAFIGGSLLPLGGQNLIEPLAVGTPVLIGPSTFNFAETAREALARGAARQGADADAIVVEATALLRDPELCARMTVAGTELLAAHRGATRRTLDWIAAQLVATRA
jgi:3-deoxy-D-manno-octulosonic-acid transferase